MVADGIGGQRLPPTMTTMSARVSDRVGAIAESATLAVDAYARSAVEFAARASPDRGYLPHGK